MKRFIAGLIIMVGSGIWLTNVIWDSMGTNIKGEIILSVIFFIGLGLVFWGWKHR